MRHTIPEGYEPRKSADAVSRSEKARLIERLIGSQDELEGRRILEIGCGNGVITSALARLAGPRGAVWGIDVIDRLATSEGFKFVKVDGTDLPIRTDSMDVVVSNHVIEHVGSALDQYAHLREIARVLRPDGFCYLATPNRWWVVEPHFSLPFLSWLPSRMQQTYVRVSGRAKQYDCRLMSRRDLIEMTRAAQLAVEDLTPEAIAISLRGSALTARLPDALCGGLARISPTYIMKLRAL